MKFFENFTFGFGKTTTVTESVDEQVLNNEWEEPAKLQTTALDEITLTPEDLPESVRDFVFSNAYRLNDASPEFVAGALLACAAAVIGNSAIVQPKRFDTGWTVTPTLWSCVVGEPSKMKSPTLDVAQSLIPEEDSFGRKTDIVIGDVTKEALTVKLVDNPKGMLFCRDELSGWLSGLYSEKRAPERGFFLSAFDGNHAHKETRLGRDDVNLDETVLSLVGTIQPSMLAPLLRSRSVGQNNDGLFERIQVLFYSTRPQTYTDVAPDEKADAKAREVFRRLLAFRESNHKTRFIFSEEAQELVTEYNTKLVERSNTEEAAHLQAVLIKYAALFAKFSLIFHLFSITNENEFSCIIEAEHARMATKWMALVEFHYHKVMSLVTEDPKIEVAKSLLSKLPELPKQFNKRHLQRKNWKGLTTNAKCQQAIDCLLEHGYLKEVIESPNGKPRTSYLIHPDFHK